MKRYFFFNYETCLCDHRVLKKRKVVVELRWETSVADSPGKRTFLKTSEDRRRALDSSQKRVIRPRPERTIPVVWRIEKRVQRPAISHDEKSLGN